MPLYAIDGKAPDFEDADTNWIAPDATLIGNVRIGSNAGFWFGVVIRGDGELIAIGADTNVQEHTIMHTDPGFPLTIGKGCTIGHRALLHGCTIGDNSLIGMGAIVLNGAKIGAHSLVGAGALITEGKEFPDRSVILGAPAKRVRDADEKTLAMTARAAEVYVRRWKQYAKGLERLG